MGLDVRDGLLDFSFPVGSGVDGWNVWKGEEEEQSCDDGAEQVDEEHHLLPSDLVLAEDLVLSRVCSAIDGQVNNEEEEPPDT